ncbi:MAG: tRNA (N(6)-L-threonylcarbamoyladenosine(37)-C(2))-methylthiotransferase [Candidatus Norongarragalinales archaeon]
MQGSRMKVFIRTYGCTFNQADSDRMALTLKEHEHEIAESEDAADVVVLNTCSVKDATQQKILYKVSHTAKPLVVAGCLVQAAPAIVAKSNPSASLVGTFSQASIVEAVENAFAGKKTVATKNNGIPALAPFADGIFARIQINSGCASACTFCSTKLARGGVKSYRPREIVEAVARVVAQGAKEIQLTSQDTGAYGLDCGVALPQLLERICEIEGDFRVRVGMCNPQHFLRMEKDLIRVFAQNEKLYKFFHIAIQSGSDSVLKHMRRGYSAEQAKQAIQSIKNAFPDAMLATDVIVGYPTETEEDFGRTLGFLQWAEFDVVNVSKYSARPKTPAARLEQIKNSEVKSRSEIASALARKILEKKNKRFVGARERVLVTEKTKNGFLSRTKDYRPVILPKAEAGVFLEAVVSKALATCLVGEGTKAF